MPPSADSREEPRDLASNEIDIEQQHLTALYALPDTLREHEIRRFATALRQYRGRGTPACRGW